HRDHPPRVLRQLSHRGVLGTRELIKAKRNDPGISPGPLHVTRWRWDSNPRWSCPHTRFRGVLLWPLGHATAVKDTWPPQLGGIRPDSDRSAQLWRWFCPVCRHSKRLRPPQLGATAEPSPTCGSLGDGQAS